MGELLAVAGLAVACGAWVVVQRWARRLDPHEPGVGRCCGACSGPCREGLERPVGEQGAAVVPLGRRR